MKYLTASEFFTNDLYKDIGRVFIGLDDQLNKLSRIHNELPKLNNYPPYNIIKLSDIKYKIEIAIAGFSIDDLDIVVDKNILTIKGKVESESKESDIKYLHKGIANRSFVRSFTLDEHIEVGNAELIQGILHIYLDKNIPEDKQPKKIKIV